MVHRGSLTEPDKQFCSLKIEPFGWCNDECLCTSCTAAVAEWHGPTSKNAWLQHCPPESAAPEGSSSVSWVSGMALLQPSSQTLCLNCTFTAAAAERGTTAGEECTIRQYWTAVAAAVMTGTAFAVSARTLLARMEHTDRRKRVEGKKKEGGREKWKGNSHRQLCEYHHLV